MRGNKSFSVYHVRTFFRSSSSFFFLMYSVNLILFITLIQFFYRDVSRPEIHHSFVSFLCSLKFLPRPSYGASSSPIQTLNPSSSPPPFHTSFFASGSQINAYPCTSNLYLSVYLSIRHTHLSHNTDSNTNTFVPIFSSAHTHLTYLTIIHSLSLWAAVDVR